MHCYPYHLPQWRMLCFRCPVFVHVRSKSQLSLTNHTTFCFLSLSVRCNTRVWQKERQRLTTSITLIRVTDARQERHRMYQTFRVDGRSANWQEAQLMLTNPRDAFRGQSRSSNIVPFHMLGTIPLCNFVFKTLRFYDIRLQKMSTLKSGSEVTQGHWKWYDAIDCVSFPISVPC